MIEHLTIQKLLNYGFISEDIEHFEKWDNYELMFHKSVSERYWASNIEKKIYSGKDASRKYYFRTDNYITFPKDQLDLLPEYFEKRKNVFLEKRKKLAGDLYNEKKSKEHFKELELERVNKELEAAKNEFLNPKSTVTKLVAEVHREGMQIYFDWLNEYIEPVEAPVLQPSIMKYFRPIPKTAYHRGLIRDEEIMTFYESVLKKTNDRLTLQTSIKELAEIYAILDRWNNVLSVRQSNSPSPSIATEEFKKELLQLLEYDDNFSSNDKVNDGKYWNQFRKISYSYLIKGELVNLRYLGYLILKYQCGSPNGEEVIENITNIFNVNRVLESLAEGAAIAEFVHSDKRIMNATNNKSSNKALFKPQFDSQVYIDLLKDTNPKILNMSGEYILGDKKKAYVVTFFDVLEEQGVTNYFSAKDKAKLIEQLIPNFKITSRSLLNTTADAQLIKTQFEKLIKNV